MMLADHLQHRPDQTCFLRRRQTPLHMLFQHSLLGAGQRIGFQQDLVGHIVLAHIVQQGGQAQDMDVATRKLELFGQRQGKYRDIERVIVDLLACGAIAHQVKGDIPIREQGIEHAIDQAIGLGDDFFRAGMNVFFQHTHRLRRVAKRLFALNHGLTMRFEFGDSGTFGHERGFVFHRMRRLGNGRGDGRLRGANKRRFNIAFRRRVANLLQPQAPELFQLLVILDLEATEGKWVIHPRQIKVDIQADAQLLGRKIRTGFFVGHGALCRA